MDDEEFLAKRVAIIGGSDAMLHKVALALEARGAMHEGEIVLVGPGTDWNESPIASREPDPVEPDMFVNRKVRRSWESGVKKRRLFHP